MKDNFSEQAADYAKYRPGYPPELIDFVMSQVSKRDKGWDCATGNGQLAKMLSPHFEKVYGTDISQQQLDNAYKAENINYSKQEAEKTDFPKAFFDLIVVGQAVHWFDFDRFFKEVYRVAKSHALIALVGYDLVTTTPLLDELLFQLYKEVLGGYWDIERRHIDAGYTTIPFPFEELPTPQFRFTANWTFEQLCGYLSTWSAVQHYQKANKTNPVEALAVELKKAWGEEKTLKITFPIICRLGRLNSQWSTVDSPPADFKG